MIKKMNDTDFKEKISKEEVAYINYSASWCAPCKRQLPLLEELSNSEEFKNINIYYCDVDENINTSSDANIRGVPTIVKYQFGNESKRKVGGSSEQDLKEFFLKD